MINREDIGIVIQNIVRSYRQILHMRYCLGMSYEEIASKLNIPVSQAKQLMYQARSECKQALLNKETPVS